MESTKEARVFGKQLNISRRHAAAICREIRGKSIEDAISLMESVIAFKKPIKFQGEISHKKGIASARYPINASKQFIKMLKNLSANASVKGIDADSLKIKTAKTDKAVDKRGGRFLRFKRANVLITGEGAVAEKRAEKAKAEEKKEEVKEKIMEVEQVKPEKAIEGEKPEEKKSESEAK